MVKSKIFFYKFFNLKSIILLALMLRIIVSFLGEHGDVINYYWWSKDLVANGLLGFYDRNITNAMRPTYPPVTSYLFLIAGQLHQFVWNISWFVNTHISIFPSRIVLWLETDHGWYVFNKLPAIFADIGIIYLGHLFVKDLKDKKSGLIVALLFAFVPVFWYNSSFWGQTDSVFALPMLASFYALYKDKPKLSIFLYGLAILTKPTAFFALPVFGAWFLRKTKIIDLISGLAIFLIEVVFLYLPFHPANLIPWIIKFYEHSLGGELNYLVANAFNLWALVFGFDNRPDTSLFLGLPANFIGNIIFIILALLAILIVLEKRKIKVDNVLVLASILSFSAFMFLPRMHDRYFYPVLILLGIVIGVNRKFKNIFWSASTLHLINLYHFWWKPSLGIIVSLLSNPFVEKALILANISTFLWLIIIYRREYVEKT